VATATVGASSTWSGHRHPDSEADEWAPRGFEFFSNLSKTSSTLKNQKWVPYLIPKIPSFCARLA
jgi:hypothetical protein